MSGAPRSLHVTDHALIRYMERVLELDLGRIREEISAKVLTGAVAGADVVTVAGIVYKLGVSENRAAVVTLWPEKGAAPKPPPPSRQRSHQNIRANRWRRTKKRRK